MICITYHQKCDNSVTLRVALVPATVLLTACLLLSVFQVDDGYLILFEDTSYPDGYSPPLAVAQRYVIPCHDD